MYMKIKNQRASDSTATMWSYERERERESWRDVDSASLEDPSLCPFHPTTYEDFS